jgi:tripartite-type tricarboxylate transporter receptor subunit TctC
MNDLLAGRIDMSFSTVITLQEQIRSGALRALAVTTRERTALLPDLPSLHESGVANYDVTSWAALFAPAGTPKPVVEKLNTEVRKIVDSAEVKRRLGDAGFDAFSSAPEQLDKFVQEQLALWTRLIKDSGIEPQ